MATTSLGQDEQEIDIGLSRLALSDQSSRSTSSSPSSFSSPTHGNMLSPNHSLRPHTNPPSLYSVIADGNKFGDAELAHLWEFRIQGLDEPLGYMRNYVKAEMKWDSRYFIMDEETMVIKMKPIPLEGESILDACRRIFRDLCIAQRDQFNGCLNKWIAKDDAAKDLQPLYNTMSNWQGLTIPLPARGLFGVVTMGVHMNMYTVEEVDGVEVVDRIWVSNRAVGEGISYPGMLDQIVAGGMDTVDKRGGLFCPEETLKREAMEEAGLALDTTTKIMYSSNCWYRQAIGYVQEVPYITFYDCKDIRAGAHNEDHLEPGIRFVFDLKLEDPTFQPSKTERNIEKFESFTVDEVKDSLRNHRWKPNCGLVMVDFLVRKGLLTDENDPRLNDIKAGLRRELPFDYTRKVCRFMRRWE